MILQINSLIVGVKLHAHSRLPFKIEMKIVEKEDGLATVRLVNEDRGETEKTGNPKNWFYWPKIPKIRGPVMNSVGFLGKGKLTLQKEREKPYRKNSMGPRL